MTLEILWTEDENGSRVMLNNDDEEIEDGGDSPAACSSLSSAEVLEVAGTANEDRAIFSTHNKLVTLMVWVDGGRKRV